MKTSKAIRIAVQVLKKEIQRVAVDANLHDSYGMDTAHGRAASKRRAELREVQAELETLLDDLLRQGLEGRQVDGRVS